MELGGMRHAPSLARAPKRVPAHDASGRTSQQSDGALFQITKYGRFASMPGEPSRMSAFKDRLTDDPILAIIASSTAVAQSVHAPRKPC